MEKKNEIRKTLSLCIFYAGWDFYLYYQPPCTMNISIGQNCLNKKTIYIVPPTCIQLKDNKIATFFPVKTEPKHFSILCSAVVKNFDYKAFLVWETLQHNYNQLIVSIFNRIYRIHRYSYVFFANFSEVKALSHFSVEFLQDLQFLAVNIIFHRIHRIHRYSYIFFATFSEV